MSSQRTRDDAEPSTRDALLDAALDQLERRGVLAGLNLREVASDVGVTPANIYHYFGSRQGLLRAALAREMRFQIETAVPLTGGRPGAPFAKTLWRASIFADEAVFLLIP